MDIRILASGSTGNCYRVSDGKTNLLIECGLPFKRIQEGLNFRLSDIHACLVSHEHKDHSKAVEDVTRAGIDCYLSQGTADVLGATGHRVKIMQPLSQLKIGTFAILPFDVKHDAAEPLGFLLHSLITGERLLYATDTYYIKYKFNKLDYIMIECNFMMDVLTENVESGAVPFTLKRRLLTSHFNLDNVKDFLKANELEQTKAIWLIHMSNGNCDAERAKREIQELTGKPVYVA